MGTRALRTSGTSVRQALLRFVTTHLAAHKAYVAERLGVGWSTVQHHAKVLVRQKKLREVPYRGLRILVPAKVSPKMLPSTIALGIPQHRQALRALVDHRMQRIQEVARRLRWPRKTARRSLYALVEAGLATKSVDYHPRFNATQIGRSFARRFAAQTRTRRSATS